MHTHVDAYEMAVLLCPGAECGCGHPVRMHLTTATLGCRWCACTGVHDCAEVDAEYERIVAERVGRMLTAQPKAEGETMWWISPNQPYSFGFSGFTYNGAVAVASRYTPGTRVRASAWQAAYGTSALICAPAVERIDTPTLDTSWGAERAALREYLKPHILEPESVRRNRIVIERLLFPLLSLDLAGSTSVQGWWIRGRRDAHDLVQRADTYPQQILGWTFVGETV